MDRDDVINRPFDENDIPGFADGANAHYKPSAAEEARRIRERQSDKVADALLSEDWGNAPELEEALPKIDGFNWAEQEPMFVRIQRLVDEDGNIAGWVVDLENSPLADTSSRFFAEHREQDARAFADDLAALVIADVRQVEDDAL